MEQWLLENLGSDGSHHSGGIRLVIVLCIIVVSFIAYFIVKYAVIPVIQKIVKQTETQWDDILLSERVCRSFSHIVPPVIMLIALPYALKEPFEGIVVRLLQVYVIYAVCYFISAFMRGHLRHFCPCEGTQGRLAEGHTPDVADHRLVCRHHSHG